MSEPLELASVTVTRHLTDHGEVLATSTTGEPTLWDVAVMLDAARHEVLRRIDHRQGEHP